MTHIPVHRKSIPSIALLGLLTLGGAITGSANGQWTTVGPDGGSVLVLVVNPVTPSTLYAGTFRGGVFKSTDGGASWRAMNAGLLDQFGLPALEVSYHQKVCK